MHGISNILERLSTRAKNALVSGQKLAESANHDEIGTEHLLYGIVREKNSFAAEVVLKRKFSAEQIREAVLQLNPTRLEPQLRPQLSEEMQQTLERAAMAASRYNYQFIGTEHLLYGIIELDTVASRLLSSLGTPRETLQSALKEVFENFSRIPELVQTEDDLDELPIPEDGPNLLPASSKTPSLDYFTLDLTAKAKAGKIDPVIGRNAEIERLTNILSRRTKSNPLLLGEPGVGKTAIVEGLARAITTHNVPDFLLDKKILSLDLALVVAGSMFRGEFENRLKHIIDEARSNPNVVLFIDELHAVIGAGATTGSLDAANILKPALARGEITVIGATTLADYKRYIETDPALERRFQPIIIEEPTATEALEILRGLRPHFERHHNVTIDDEALHTAVQLSQRYLTDRFLPDKAIDIIDEAAASLRKSRETSGSRREIREFEESIAELERQKTETVLRQDFRKALKIKLEQDRFKTQIAEINQKLEATLPIPPTRLTADHILATVSLLSKIPLSQLAASEIKKLQRLEVDLKNFIVGQDEVLSVIAQTIRRARTGIASPLRPSGSFLFLGPSGVGKTETAKSLARLLFGSERNLIRIDMSEFMERHNVARLIGAPAGYVGFQEGGKLTETVRRNPYSVVLFDEIEKAHPDVHNLLLQILEEGELTDATGKKINFRNTIVILTSNLGGAEFSKQRLGFAASQDEELSDANTSVLSTVREKLAPELVNRIDTVAVFRPLDAAAIKKIVALELSRLSERLFNEHKLRFVPDERLVDFLHKHAFEPGIGARKVRAAIRTHVENPLSEQLLRTSGIKHQEVNLKPPKSKLKPVEVTFR